MDERPIRRVNSPPIILRGVGVEQLKTCGSYGQQQEWGNYFASEHPERGESHAGASIQNAESSLLISNLPIGTGPKCARGTITLPSYESQHHIVDATNPGRALDNSVEDRLHVRRRAADDAEDLGRRRLMLQSLAQFRVARLRSLGTAARSRWQSRPARQRFQEALSACLKKEALPFAESPSLQVGDLHATRARRESSENRSFC